MKDPLILAAEIEEATEIQLLDLTTRELRLAAAAIRLAEAWCLPGKEFSEKKMDAAARAYKKARQG